MCAHQRSVVHANNLQLLSDDANRPVVDRNRPDQSDQSSIHVQTEAGLSRINSQSISKDVREYYRRLAEFQKDVEDDKEWIRRFELRQQATRNESLSRSDDNDLRRQMSSEEISSSSCNADTVLSSVTFLVNFFLLVIKLIASFLSGSLSVISSAVDSAVDLSSGLIFMFSTRAIRNRDPYKYPRGRTRMEPLAIIVVSILMGILSLEVITESVEKLIAGTSNPVVHWPTIAIMLTTIAVKLVLVVVCYSYKSPSSMTLAQDHKNDCISNSVAIVCAYLGHNYHKEIDPIGAIIVGIYIFVSWYNTGLHQTAILTGKAASPDYINRILTICINHSPKILCIDTIHAYHFGTNFLVEVDVVMAETMSLKESHDVAELLQRKIEHLPYVERAFIHVDYEFQHRPDYEHKTV